MSQFARIIRNLIDAEVYAIEHREWLEGLFLPLSASQEDLDRAIQRAYRPGARPLADPKSAYVQERPQSFVRRTNDRYVKS